MNNKNIIQKIKDRFSGLTEEQIRVNELLPANLSEREQALYEVVLKNQVRHSTRSFQSQRFECPNCKTDVSATETLETIATKLSVHTLDGLMILNELVGFQPMEGPVGLVYKLRTKTIDDQRLSLEIMKDTIEAGSRKLAAGLCMEPSQSRTLPDVEDELLWCTGGSIANEYINEILGDIDALAKKHSDDTTAPYEDYQFENANMLVCRINQAASRIAAITRRGAGNFVVISHDIYEVLKDSSAFESKLIRSDSLMRLQPAGEVTHIKVYVDTHDEENRVLVGYKGSSDVDCGLILCPFVPIMSTGIVMDPLTFEPHMSFMTRYCKFHDEMTKDYYRGFKVILDK